MIVEPILDPHEISCSLWNIFELQFVVHNLNRVPKPLLWTFSMETYHGPDWYVAHLSNYPVYQEVLSCELIQMFFHKWPVFVPLGL